MPRKGANISLSSYDDIFKTDEGRNDTGEHVVMMDLEKIHPFKNHPFKVVDDEDMRKTADSPEIWRSGSGHCAPDGERRL